MNEVDEKIFRTKTGYCHILPDKIVLTRDGIIGNLTEIAVGNTIFRILFIYFVLSLGLFYFAFNGYRNGQIIEVCVFTSMGLYVVYGILNSINNSATPIIDRRKIKEVKYKKEIAGLTRARFEVLFEDGQGKIKKRLIMLPGSMNDGKRETAMALDIMREEKFIE